MTEKLDKFRPSPETLAGVRTQLVNAGIDPYDIPNVWVEATVAATAKWIQQTEAGLDFVSRLLHLSYERGRDNKDYEIVDDDTLLVETVKPEDIFMISGCIANRRPVPFHSVNVCEKETSQCDSCGITSHCLQNVTDPFSGKLQELCNRCITYHEHPRIHELGGRGVCEMCSVKSCKHHPDRELPVVGPSDQELPWREHDYCDSIPGFY